MRVVSLFCGAGGLDLGFKKAGHEIIWSNDFDKDSVETYRKNIGAHVVHDDISNISVVDIPECDIVIGGFPCQGFSVANMNRHVADSRNQLYLQLLKVITYKQPKFFLAENVKGLMSLGKGEILKMILKDFTEAGYRVSYKVLNAADFGVPQKRERLFIIGVRNDVNDKIEFPNPTHAPLEKADALGLLPWVSVGKALENIPEPESDHNLSNHTYSKFKLKFNGYLGNRHINPDLPSPTVTARGDTKGGVVVLHHPRNHRRMSVRELAIVQSFPLDFVFHCNQSSAYRLIGNAVSPKLAEIIGNQFPKSTGAANGRKSRGTTKTD
ncbi:DNA cytosine methyltransferase [Undibacterium sp. MH2W]|uniref:DNA cytosine methyltransferase n=1 Tax=Undibacterium sp. MH2W TaxID=3413044 RepID=UPI003BEF6BEF